VVSKDSAAIEKSKDKLRKLSKKNEKDKAKEDAIVEISLDDVLAPNILPEPTGTSIQKTIQSAATTSSKFQSSTAAVIASDDDSDLNSEVEEQEKALDRKGKAKAYGVKAFEQRDLVALAFAGDNVVEVCSSRLPELPLLTTVFLQVFSRSETS
jgi:U3 small nucleolar RNA-associated protein 14